MKDFMKQTFATVLGIVIFAVAMGIIGVISILGMVASSDSTPKVMENSVLVLQLSGQMQERSEDDFYGFLSGGEMSSLGLDEMLSAVEMAKNDENVKGIYLEAGMFVPDGVASVQALRNKLVEFKNSKSFDLFDHIGDLFTCHFNFPPIIIIFLALKNAVRSVGR